MDDAKEYVRKLNIISINNANKEPEPEIEKEENDVNRKFFGLIFLTANNLHNKNGAQYKKIYALIALNNSECSFYFVSFG